MQKKFLEAGKIVNTHGLTGELKVQSWCDSPELLCELDTLYLDAQSPVHVIKAYVHKHSVIMKLEGVHTIEQAQQLKNRMLYLNREDVALPDDLVFIQDILGFTVHDIRTNSDVGCLRSVLTENLAQDLYEISTEDGRLCYVPAIAPFLKQIDMEKRIIMIESIEGLL